MGKILLQKGILSSFAITVEFECQSKMELATFDAGTLNADDEA